MLGYVPVVANDASWLAAFNGETEFAQKRLFNYQGKMQRLMKGDLKECSGDFKGRWIVSQIQLNAIQIQDQANII